MKKTGNTRREKTRAGRNGTNHGPDSVSRSWPISLVSAVGVVGLLVVISATVNPLIGRNVHWDWMAGLAPTVLVLLTLALRRRWV